LVGSPMQAQPAPAALPEGPSAQASEEEMQKLLAQRKAELERRNAEQVHRQAELAQRQVELAQRNAELAQRKIELAKRQDPLKEYFSPERLMQHQQELGLQEGQKHFIQTEAQRAQAQFTEWQKQLEKEREMMISLSKADRTDDAQILAQLDR